MHYYFYTYWLLFVFFIQYRYCQRLRILQAVAAQGVQLLPRTPAFDLKSPNPTYQPTTISYLQIVASNLEQIRYIDFVLAALCFAALIVTVIFIIVMKRKLGRRSSLYADIGTANEIIQLKITDFPDASEHFQSLFLCRNLDCKFALFFVAEF
jgi:hypothetical protein